LGEIGTGGTIQVETKTLTGAPVFSRFNPRDAITRIAERHGATQVRLIGSVARGEARPDSDVDLLVTWREGTGLLDQAALKLELESLLGRRVDIACDGWVKASIRESVYRDAVAM
jgi:predicted nucleotidyltransferase